jgi:hypothetical protein
VNAGCHADASAAFKLFDKLVRNGCADTIHLNVILKACGTVAEIEEVLGQCAHVIEPDVISIRTLIRKYRIEGRQEAQIYFKLDSCFGPRFSPTMRKSVEDQFRIIIRSEGNSQLVEQRLGMLRWILGGATQAEITSALQFATCLNENRVSLRAVLIRLARRSLVYEDTESDPDKDKRTSRWVGS